MLQSWLFRWGICLLIVGLAAGCTPSSSDPQPAAGQANPAGNANSNPFEAGQAERVILGDLGHGLVNPDRDENGDIRPLRYDGGELHIPYAVHASGKAKNVGFLVFIDGIAQPYKLNTTDAPYQYMHIFELEQDNKDTAFTFVFTPVTGKQGDTLSISITSIYNPGFIPDMKATSSYGGYHSTLEAGGSLYFTKDADALAPGSIPQLAYASDVRSSTEPVTKELLQAHSGMEAVDMDLLEQRVYSDLYIDGELKRNHVEVKDSGPLHVRFKIFGHPGVRFRNTFYINHQAVTSKVGNPIETVLAKGDVAVLDFDLDLGKLDDFSTIYMVSVPMNAADFPADVLVLQKTLSLLLYKG
ncbi:hypothetical protein [Paenibacillus popilliae]|nr:hypothetical protein [Paenibacillus popilliae]